MSKKHRSAPVAPKEQQNGRSARWLPGTLAVVALAVVALLIWFAQKEQNTASFEPEVTGQAKAVIDKTDFDYGDVKLNTTIETVFRVRNTGDQPLVFLREPDVEVREGC